MIALFKPLGLPTRVSVGLLLLRVVAGLAFMYHGFGKLQSPASWMGPDSSIPGVLQVLAAVSEFGGGLAWVLGVLTPLASFLIGCVMSVALYMHIYVFHDVFVASGSGHGSYELPLTYLCTAILLLLAGPGRFSLDRFIFGQKGA